MSNEFYAYIHAKPDGTPFYVGKGRRDRKRVAAVRNTWHTNIVGKYGPENILVGKLDCSTEAIAFELEKGLIKCLRRMGIKLCNLTDGGEGMSGYTPTDGTKEKNRAAAIRMWATPGHKAKLAKAMAELWADATYRDVQRGAHQTAVKAEEYRRKLSEAHKKRCERIEVREQLAISAKKSWEQDPERKVRASKAIRKTMAAPEYRAKRVEDSKKMWADPEVRSKIVAGITKHPKGASTKLCWACKETKRIAEFHTRKASADGYHGACKLCRCQKEKDRRKAKRESV